VDFGGRKIGPNSQKFWGKIAYRIVLFALAICKLGKELGLFERLLAGALALCPQGTDLGHILLDGALDALLIESQKLDVPAGGEPGAGLGERFIDGKLGRIVSGGPGQLAEFPLLAESEDGGFDGAGAFEAPAIFGDGLGEIEVRSWDRCFSRRWRGWLLIARWMSCWWLRGAAFGAALLS